MTTLIKTPESSNIAGFGYDENNHILIVEFKHGDVYRYYGVPKSVFENMKKADSKGKFLNSEVKNIYRYEKQ